MKICRELSVMLRENVTSRRQQIITLREVGKNLFRKKIVKLNSPLLLAPGTMPSPLDSKNKSH